MPAKRFGCAILKITGRIDGRINIHNKSQPEPHEEFRQECRYFSISRSRIWAVPACQLHGNGNPDKFTVPARKIPLIQFADWKRQEIVHVKFRLAPGSCGSQVVQDYAGKPALAHVFRCGFTADACSASATLPLSTAAGRWLICQSDVNFAIWLPGCHRKPAKEKVRCCGIAIRPFAGFFG